MSKSLRLSEKWFRFGLWIVAFVFASFLIGLGGAVIHNLPKVEHRYTQEDFIDKVAAAKLREELKSLGEQRQTAQEAQDQANLRLNSARANASTARETFSHWLATRQVTRRPDQDPELIERTRLLEELKVLERKALADVERTQQSLLDARQAETHRRSELNELEREAATKLDEARRKQELRVFGYRLAMTLPLLVIAGWMFKTKRQSTWWPFVWGYIYFSLFVFFVELVPYLPSYGGFVRYIVGIIVTVVVGRQGVLALNRYLEKQKEAEARPDVERRKDLDYDIALARLGKKVCPGCERPVDLTHPEIDFCPHCGICLFERCGGCQARKSAFARFCHACGLVSKAPQGAESAVTTAGSAS